MRRPETGDSSQEDLRITCVALKEKNARRSPDIAVVSFAMTADYRTKQPIRLIIRGL
jgi:hypothetical protein